MDLAHRKKLEVINVIKAAAAPAVAKQDKQDGEGKVAESDVEADFMSNMLVEKIVAEVWAEPVAQDEQGGSVPECALQQVQRVC